MKIPMRYISSRHISSRYISSLFCGLIFGLGLAVSGMLNPTKVSGFLDLAGAWDPSLAFVMGGGLAVNAVAFRFIRRRQSPLLASGFKLPMARQIDRRLMLGAALFGIGWALAGLCPGPAIAGLAYGTSDHLLFFATMMGGLKLSGYFKKMLRN